MIMSILLDLDRWNKNYYKGCYMNFDEATRRYIEEAKQVLGDIKYSEQMLRNYALFNVIEIEDYAYRLYDVADCKKMFLKQSRDKNPEIFDENFQKASTLFDDLSEKFIIRTTTLPKTIIYYEDGGNLLDDTAFVKSHKFRTTEEIVKYFSDYDYKSILLYTIMFCKDKTVGNYLCFRCYATEKLLK